MAAIEVLEPRHLALGAVGEVGDEVALLGRHGPLDVVVAHVHPGPLGELLAPAQVLVDGLRGLAAVADGGSQQVEAQGVTAGEQVLGALDPVAAVDVEPVGAVIQPLEAVEHRVLADGGEDPVGLQLLLRSFLGLELVVADLLQPHHLQPPGPAAGEVQQARHADAGAELGAFVDGVVDLLGVGVHAVATGAGQDGDLGAQAQGGSGHVHGGVAAADHHHVALHLVDGAAVDLGEVLHAGQAVLGLGEAVHGELAAAVGAQAQEDRVVALAQLVQADVAAHAGAGAHLHPHVDDPLDLAVDHLPRAAVGGQAVLHHAAELLVGLEDGDGMPAPAELVGGGQTAGTGADHGHLLAGGGTGLPEGESVLQGVVAEELLDAVDAHRVLDAVPVARLLAGGGAGPAHDAGERVGLHQALPGGGVGILGRLQAAHQAQVAADVLPGGAAVLAGRRAQDVGRALEAVRRAHVSGGAVLAGLGLFIEAEPGKAPGLLTAGFRWGHRGSSLTPCPRAGWRCRPAGGYPRSRPWGCRSTA